MDGEITARAYAKINFGLTVFPKRKDGSQEFHSIEGIFQTIDLYDELTVSWNESKGCSVRCASVHLPEKNTLTSSYQAFCEVAGCNVPGVDIELVKGIPSGGGLGGGSADAAALVRLLEKRCGVRLSYSQLDYIAERTGSDVFFFLHCDGEGRGCALVSGRGEVVRRIRPRHDLFLVLVFPKAGSPTKTAYALLDEAFGNGMEIESPDFSELEGIYNGSVERWSFVNTFTPVISEACPEVAEALAALRKTGCPFAEMSGSGSTVFAVFETKEQALNVCSLLDDAWDYKTLQTV